jgi:hypothetical protein
MKTRNNNSIASAVNGQIFRFWLPTGTSHQSMKGASESVNQGFAALCQPADEGYTAPSIAFELEGGLVH